MQFTNSLHIRINDRTQLALDLFAAQEQVSLSDAARIMLNRGIRYTANEDKRRKEDQK